MRKLILTAAGAVALTTASFLPLAGAQAMTPGAANSVRTAAAAIDPSETVRCWRPCRGCRVVCNRPRVYGGGYYGPYYGAPYYGGYYGPGVGVWGPGIGIGIGVGPRWGW